MDEDRATEIALEVEADDVIAWEENGEQKGQLVGWLWSLGGFPLFDG